jgi:hypothetical protein
MKLTDLTPEDQTLVNNWLSLMRSGDYRQARNMLCDGKGYCCLGLFCIAAGRQVSTSPRRIRGHAEDDEPKFAEQSQNYQFVRSILGHSMVTDLGDANDSGYTFPQIADATERALSNNSNLDIEYEDENL